MGLTILPRRSSQFSDKSVLSETQYHFDQTLHGFSQQMGDAKNLLAMTAGSFAFRISKLGFLQGAKLCGVTPLAPKVFTQGAANLFALATEVTALRGTHHHLSLLSGLQPHEGVFHFKGWNSTGVDLLALRIMGPLGGQNLFLSHFTQANAIIAGHEISASLGLTDSEAGSYVQKLAKAEATQIAFKAAKGFTQHLAPTMARAEAKMELRLQSQQVPTRIHLQEPLAMLQMASKSNSDKGVELKLPQPSLKSQKFKRRLQQQAFIIGQATLTYSTITPLIVDLITQAAKWPSLNQVAVMAANMTLFSFVVVYGLIPAGARLQSSLKPNLKILGKVATIGLEAGATIGLLEAMGLIYGWDPIKVLKTGAIMGATQGFPLSTISQRWGKERPMFATILRQITMACITTNTAVINTLASQEQRSLNPLEIIEIGALNLGLWWMLSKVPFSEKLSTARN